MSGREAASDDEAGDKPTYSGVVIHSLINTRRKLLPHEATETVGEVIRAWVCHWFPHVVERLILELRITVVRPSYYIWLFILCRVATTGKG